MKSLFGLIIFNLLIWGAQAFASPCCGGSSSSSQAYILGDQSLLIQTQFSVATEDQFVDDKGYWSAQQKQTAVTSLKAASLISESLQVAATLPLAKEGESWAPRDMVIGLGWELLPEKSYGLFPPKLIASINTLIRQGDSIYESTTQSDTVYSNGQSQLGLSLLAIKGRGSFDYLADVQIAQLFPENYAQVELKTGHSWGAHINIGYYFQSWRFGFGAGYDYTRKNFSLTNQNKLQKSESQKFPAVISLAKTLNSSWSASYALSDNGVIGSPLNTTLQTTHTLTFTFNQLR
ncbi:MAG: hypothetical protein ACLGGX_09915 [Bdellovibrionia bacterium]